MKFGTALFISVALTFACDSADKGAPVAAGKAASPTQEAAPAKQAEPVEATKVGKSGDAPKTAALPPGLIKPGDAKVGDKTWCLTSGEVFTVTKDSPKAQYEGKTYYFCCGGCDEEFLAKPKALLETPPDLANAEAPMEHKQG